MWRVILENILFFFFVLKFYVDLNGDVGRFFKYWCYYIYLVLFKNGFKLEEIGGMDFGSNGFVLYLLFLFV